MKNLDSDQLRRFFLDFFEEKGHKVVPSASLIPADPTSLFTSAGMQQFVPYLSGEREPPYKRACSVQKCLRVDDIDEVGDSTHHTFFEMMGNWSFGDYFKEKAVDYALEFLTERCGISKQRLWVSIFEGKGGIPRDGEAEKIWKERGVPKNRIFEYGAEENFWGPVTSVGPCGPCSEIFYERDRDPCGSECHPNCDCGRFVEVWNLVFMEYDKKKDGSFEKLNQHNVDTGVGFERLLALLQEKETAYDTDLFHPLVLKLEEFSGKRYAEHERRFRIIVDHLRASCFMGAEGVRPSNTDRGYVLRMILRRMFRHLYQVGVCSERFPDLVEEAVGIYETEYPELRQDKEQIVELIGREEERFGRTLDKGLSRFEKLIKHKEKKTITGQEAFDLYQSYGFPLELTRELAGEKGLRVDEEGYEKAFEEHRKASRKGAEKKFGGVGIGQLEDEKEKKKAVRLHTATHLVQAALREVLGEHVKQMGSDITPDRLRFDFTHPRSLTSEEIKKVENWVNQRIEQGLEVTREEKPYEEAVEEGALAFFKARYPKKVYVYTIGREESKEICAGPHVENTGELGKFRITKEESVGAGTRRIKAILK